MIARRWLTALLVAALALMLGFLALPLAALVVEVPPRDLVSALGHREARDALLVSAKATSAALALIVIVGTPAAWFLATRAFRGRALALTVIELPLVLPPAAAGLALLTAFGSEGLVGGWLADAGLGLNLNFAAVVVALAFVAAPFYVRQAQAAFAALEPTVLEASRTLGAGEARTLARVGIPVARSGLLTGLALAWGRALGEFGATLMFAGSFQGRTQTAPLAIFANLGTDFDASLALSVVLLAIAAAVLLGLRLAGGGWEALGRARA